jgi:nucleotide-binding universal stress UspA family protein
VLQRIVVPLDGSPLAARALKQAAELATVAGARLVPMAVSHGHQPERLLAEIARQQPDLIVMSTHTSLGSLAEAVVAAGEAPVLLLHQDAVVAQSNFRSLVGQRVLVLLDGSAQAETALSVAAELAHVLDGELVLFKAVDVYSVPYAVPTELMTEPDVDVQLAWDASFDVKEAQDYLSLLRNRLNREAPDTSVQIQVQVGEFVQQVRTLEAGANIGLIVMAAHSRSRLAEALRGSALYSVLRATTYPLVVVQPSGPQHELWSGSRPVASG